jgi:hypothetical protein
MPPNFRLPDFIHVKGYKDLPHLFLVIFMVFGIIIGVWLSLQPQLFTKRASEDDLLDLKFIPDTIQVQTGKTYEAKIAINPKGERVTAAKLNMTYDPQTVAVIQIKNDGFLPVDLKVEDNFDGNLQIVYGSTIDTQSDKPGMMATIVFKVINPFSSEITVKSDSEVSVSSSSENALKNFPSLKIEPVWDGINQGEEPRYPDNLLLEKAFFPDSSPVVRDFKETFDPKPVLKPERVAPEFSMTYVKQLGSDIFIAPVQSLNQVLQEAVGGAVDK